MSMEKSSNKLPKIGMRIIKTTIAVFLSIAIYLILLLITESMGLDRNDLNSPTIIYTPFFAAIAATYALHRDKKSSLSQAKIRSFGSVVGGYFGMIVILITDSVLIDVFNLAETNFVLYTFITYVVVALAIIPLIWLTVVMKQQIATFITCLTYFSVTISIRNGGLPVFLFATNRVLSTLVGVGIALVVNNFSLIKNKNKNILFVSSIDNNLLNRNSTEMSPYLKYKINNLYYKEMPLTFITTRTLSTLQGLFNDVEVGFPIVVMNGAAVYHFPTKTYDDIFKIGPNVRSQVEKCLDSHGINYFTYSIDDNQLHCFYNQITNPAQQEYYDMCRKSNFDNFVRALLPAESGSSLYIVIEKKEIINNLVEILSSEEFKHKIDIVTFPFGEEDAEYHYLKINSVASRKENMIKAFVSKQQFDSIIVCGSGKSDIPVIELSTFSFSLNTSPSEVQEKVDLVIDDDPENIMKIFEKIYHSRKPQQTIEKIKKKYNKN